MQRFPSHDRRELAEKTGWDTRMIYFLGHGGYETFQVLGEALKEKLGEDIKIVRGLRKYRPRRGNQLIRWGTSAFRELDDTFDEVINPWAKIVHNTNKHQSIEIFREAGLNVPRVWTNKYNIDRFPVLGRDTHHHGGSDIVIINGRRGVDHDRIPVTILTWKTFLVTLITSPSKT